MFIDLTQEWKGLCEYKLKSEKPITQYFKENILLIYFIILIFEITVFFVLKCLQY